MLRRPRGRERVALLGVLEAGGARARAARSPSSSDRSLGTGARSSRQTPALLVEPWQAAVYSARLRGRRGGDRARRRRSRGVRPGPAPARRARRLRPAPARRFRGDARLRLPDRLRRGAARLPVVLVARPGRAVARGGAVRRSDRHARPPVDRPAVREVAATLGASPLAGRREVDAPLVGRAFAVAAGFAFAIALGEFGATVFVARAEQPTLPVAIFRFLGRPGEEPGPCGRARRRARRDRGRRRPRGRAAAGGRGGAL